ncbi:type III secretion system effector [Butyrivibrio fibrisolvens]|uniref:Type III secretion system effector n=1 Tax=Butyrivibrio fibrisolvens TaxID=831 RepID=A0A1H9RM74_BUTFI|nr:cell wall hydrolase [Butyrivibrio fibrisolvens]SER73890.1 type III secretion system effector [Butyrivibrio fibrisolvens]
MRKQILSALIIITVLFTELSFASKGSSMDDTIASMQEEEAKTQEKISDLEKQTQETQNAIDELNEQKEQTQNNVSSLQDQKSQLQDTVDDYSDKLETLSAEITETESAMAEVSAQIVALNEDLQAAETLRKERYESLKKRMQMTYERGGDESLLLILFDSTSLQDFLTKYEYINDIVAYDQMKMEEYQALVDSIAAQIAEIEKKEAELDEYQTQLDEKHEELADLTDTVMGQLSSTNSTLSSERSKLDDYDKQLSDLDEKMKSLESQTAAAQAELAKQIAERLALTKEDTSGSYSASASELEWLAATIQAEAGGESYTGKLAVGSVIMNRVKSSAFPNDIVSVITQTNQFASYRSGKVELIISAGSNSTCIQAAQEVLGGARVGDYLFFMTQYWADYYGISEYTMIGNHAFFYRWVTNKKSEEQSTPDTSTSEQSEPADNTQDSGSQDALPEDNAAPEATPEDNGEGDGGSEGDEQEGSGDGENSE